MSAWEFHVGQRVVCVDPSDEEPPCPQYGEVYTISWIGISGGILAVDLIELPCPPTEKYERGYQASCFRPLRERKTSIECFRALLNTTETKVEA